MKTALVLAAVAGASAAPTFAAWKGAHGKAYASKEELVLRRSVFAANAAKVEAHNNAGKGWTMSVNKFADLTGDEFKARYVNGGFRYREQRATNVKIHVASEAAALPTSVDWESAGAVTPVKNQGQCGSCWAFSTTGSVEGINFIKTGKLVSLSEQQLVDCSGSAGNQGCNGGLMDNAFGWIVKNKGLCSEASYPYTGSDGSCKKCTAVATITGYTDVQVNSDSAFATAVAQQPVSIAVEADQSSFQFYSSGVMTAACGTNLDHGVLAVGYGNMNGSDYYKVKNSWGSDWGMSGYILLARGSSYNGGAGQCGIYQSASYPTKN